MALRTSPFVMRPPGPVPFTCDAAMLFSAMILAAETEGVPAAYPALAATGIGFGAASAFTGSAFFSSFFSAALAGAAGAPAGLAADVSMMAAIAPTATVSPAAA